MEWPGGINMFSGLMPLHTPRHIGLAICSFNLATPTAMSCQDAQRKWNEAVLRPFFLQIGEANSNLQSLAKNCPCLLADVAWRWSLPEPGVALEALRSEVTVEELHDELGQHGALQNWFTVTPGFQPFSPWKLPSMRHVAVLL